MPAPSAPVGRLAPSPTGQLHVGHARTFCLAWWSVRSRGGTLRLRWEDLDTHRTRPELLDTARADLEWLGLDWDGPPLLQSADLTPYRAALDTLLATGHAYACTCSRREIRAQLSAPHGGGEVRYPATCRGRWPTPERAEALSGRPAGLRLRVPSGPRTLHDAVRGPFRTDVQSEIGDFLLARRDGAVAYQLAVVVDDARQGITEVLRGEDLLSSAARQACLQDALGLPHPTWHHVPLVVDAQGLRLAKRDGALALSTLRERGLDPRRLVLWIAASAGLPVRSPLTPAEALPAYDPARLPTTPIPFGPPDLAFLEGRGPLPPLPG